MIFQPLQLPEALQTVIQTSNHRFLVNEAGVLAYAVSCEEDMEQFSHVDAEAFQFEELMALADAIQAHREAWVQAQTQLEQTWRAVADELLDQFEAQDPGSAREATGE